MSCLQALFFQVKDGHTPFAQRKDSYSLFPVDGVLIPETFFEESKSHIYANLFYFCMRFCHTAKIELGSLLETIDKANALPLS